MPAVLQGIRMLKGQDGKTYDAGETEDGRALAAVARGRKVRHVQCPGHHGSVSTLHPLSQSSLSERVASLRERVQKGNAVLEEDKRLNPEALEAHTEAEVLKLTTKAHEQAVVRGEKVRHVQCPRHHAPVPSRCRHAALIHGCCAAEQGRA